MSEFSRVKKNQKLYKEIIEEDKTKIIESSLRDYERRVSESQFKESKYQASRYRKNHHLQTEESPFQVDQNEPIGTKEVLAQKEILRDRDLLEEFIEEVKHYNINRGLRNVQDTQMNILQNLGKTPKDEQEKPVKKQLHKEPLPQSEQDLTQEIAAIISGLDSEDLDYDEEGNDDFAFTPLDEDTDQKLSTIYDEIVEHSDKPKGEDVAADNDKLVESTAKDNNLAIAKDGQLKKFDASKKTSDAAVDGRDFKSQELLELTQTLNLKLDLHEDEIEEVSNKVTIIDKILSTLILILIIALIAIIMFGIYQVSKARGFL